MAKTRRDLAAVLTLISHPETQLATAWSRFEASGTGSVSFDDVLCWARDQFSFYRDDLTDAFLVVRGQRSEEGRDGARVYEDEFEAFLAALVEIVRRNTGIVPPPIRPQDTLVVTAEERATADDFAAVQAEYKAKCSGKGKDGKARFANCQVELHGGSWRRLFHERSLAEVLESTDEEVMKALEDAVQTAGPWVRSLTLQQLPSRMDLWILFQHATSLTSLSVTYGYRKLRLGFERSFFGMKLSDARSISECLASPAAQSMSHLGLPRNMIGDDLLRVLFGVPDMFATLSLRSIDLSHNKIGDSGAQLLATMLMSEACVVEELILADNFIRPDGAAALGEALMRNESLRVLNLRLNRLGDSGGRALCDGAIEHPTLRELNLACNGISIATMGSISGALRRSDPAPSIARLDLSGNELAEDACNMLLKALEAGNASLCWLDLRRNPITATAQQDEDDDTVEEEEEEEEGQK